jgi:RimJ/RimL family protein N-acetyltransferase
MAAIPDLSEPLSDARASIRLAAERDIPEILIAHQDDPHLASLLGLERAPTGAQLGRAMEQAVVGRAAGASVVLTILEPGSDDCRGQVQAQRFDTEHAHADLEIWVAPDARGRGLGSSALALAAAWLLDACDLVRVQFLTAPDNLPAIRTAIAAGFAREGILRSHVRWRRQRLDLIVLSRIAGDSTGP